MPNALRFRSDAPSRVEGTRKHTHLGTLRAIANRMAAGSILVRIWSVLIVGALLGVTADPLHARFAWLAVFMAITFWVVDAHFIRQRRLFRKMVDRVNALPEAEVDLLLDTSAVDGETEALPSVVFSRTPLLFHSAVIGSIAVVRWVLTGG